MNEIRMAKDAVNDYMRRIQTLNEELSNALLRLAKISETEVFIGPATATQDLITLYHIEILKYHAGRGSIRRNANSRGWDMYSAQLFKRGYLIETLDGYDISPRGDRLLTKICRVLNKTLATETKYLLEDN